VECCDERIPPPLQAVGIFGHMTANAPMKSESGKDDSVTPVKDAKQFMNSLDDELKNFNSQIDDSSAIPHFTVDTSPTKPS
jgi:hypothetical protein